MATIQLRRTTHVAPEQFVAGLSGPLEVSSATAPTSSSRCTTRAPASPTSLRAHTASGNACTTTGGEGDG